HARPRTVLPRLQVLVERKSRRSSRDLRPAGRRRGHCVYELERGHPSHSVACPCRGKRRKPLPVSTFVKTGFESAVSVPRSATHFAVQALDATGRLLGVSPTVTAGS